MGQRVVEVWRALSHQLLQSGWTGWRSLLGDSTGLRHSRGSVGTQSSPYVPSFPPIQAFVKLVQDQAALLIESNWARFKQVLVNQAYFKMEVTPPCPPNQTHSALLHPMGDISSKTPHPSLES